MTARFRHRLPFGAETDGRLTRFRLWAPAEERVAIHVAERLPGDRVGDGVVVDLARCAGGWFEATLPVAPGTCYRYRLEDGLEIPDPASRGQSGDVHGWSVVVDPTAHRWRHGAWRGRPWEETVLYELHPGAFAGGFDGVRRRLGALAMLGVTAIELMPVADFPGARNWGYDGVLPFAPDESYGPPGALKRLVDAAHGLGLMVFLDVVYNHFGPEGNYLHRIAPDFFDPERQTPWGAAIDFRQRQVRDMFIENALYWLHEYRFDGLRLDAVHAILDDASPDVLTELAERVRGTTEPGRHIHLVLENDHNEAGRLVPGRYRAQWNDDIHHAFHVLLTGEDEGYYADYADDPAGRLARCLAEGFAYQGEASRHRDGAARGQPSGHLPPAAFVSFLQNHDQIGNRAEGERLATLADPDALRAAAAILLLAPQIPLLFMGEEWGTTRPFPFFAGFDGDLADAVREGRRREFARFPAFADPVARARIPDPVAPETYARAKLDWSERTRPPHDEILALHRRLLALRARDLVPRLVGATALGARAIAPRAIAAAWRLGDGATLTLRANLGDDAVATVVAPADGPMAGEPWFELPDGAGAAAQAGVLPPRSAVWWLAAGARS